jgi:hypothetical protein
MALRPPEKPPANYWGMIGTVGSLIMAIAALITTTGKSDRDETQSNERRLCRLESAAKIGECGR